MQICDSEASGTKLQIFHDSIVSQFQEETWAQIKPNQILVTRRLTLTLS